nr:EOG090X00E0 [Sida crystallina]
MGKLRTRTKGSKGKRWAKGHSSSSNPSTKKHREAAKSNFFQPFLLNSKPTSGEHVSKGGLTEDALKQHTFASQTERLPASKAGAPSESITAPPSVFEGEFDDDVVSIRSGSTYKSQSSFKTFATGFSNCSNVSFNKLYRGFSPNSSLHKEMLSVLAAIAEVIKQQGGKETDTEYFAALMTTLDVAEASEDSLGATLCLLGLVIKRVPSTVLKLKFAPTSKKLFDLLGNHVESENSILLRSIIGCLGVLMRNQDPSVWSSSSTEQIYDAILTFIVHPKSKIRRAAQHAVCTILKGSTLLTEGENPPLLHPIASHTGKYCVQKIDEYGFGGESSSLLHLLNLLKEIFVVFPQSEVKSLSESLLKLMTLNNVLITSCAMQSFHGLLQSRPQTVTLSADLNARLITALYDYQPSLNDTQPLGGWLSVMTQAHLNLSRLELVLCAGHLPRFFDVATQLWLSERPEINQAVTPALASLLSQCLEPALTADPSVKAQAGKVVHSVELGLGFQFVQVWKNVIHLSTSLIEAVGKSLPHLLISLLQSLASMRASPRFPHETDVDYAIGKAVRICGPRFLLTKCIPLNITGQEESYEFPNSWLLPILRENVSNTELGFFVEYFVPLAQSCRARIAKCEAEKDRVGFRLFDLLQRQMWGLLPGFCKYPTDVDKSLKLIAKALGQAISERPDIRIDVMAALRQLIINSKDDAKVRTEIGRFAKNYLPLLFNLYTTKAATDEEEAQRYSAYETITFYLQITDAPLLHSLFDTAKAKLETALANLKSEDSAVVEENKFVWESVLDLLRALVVYQDEERIESFVQTCLPWILGSEHKFQKKAYRIIEFILNAETDVCSQHVRQSLKRIVKLFTTSKEVVKPTSKASRMRSLSRLAELMGDDSSVANQRFLMTAATEAVAGVKEVGEKARSAAASLLIRVGEIFQKWAASRAEGGDGWLKEYVELIMKGLQSTKEAQISNTITSLTYVVHEFAVNCTEELIDSILESICHLLISSTREVVLSCLGFIRMFVATVHTQRLPFYLKRLMDSLSAMDEEHQRAYRIRTRDIFIRLMRKCGAEFVIKMVSPDDVVLLKRLNNLRKIEARKKKLKSQKESVDDEDDNEESAMTTRPKTMEHVLADSDDEEGDDLDERDKRDSRKRSVNKAWIQESGDIVDFLDPTAAQKVSATNPRMDSRSSAVVKRKKTENPFKFAADGRMIIDDDDSDSDSSEAGSDGALSQALDNLAVGRKRKAGGDHSTDVASIDEPAFKYQAGGSGIHRPVAAPSEANSRRSSTVKKVTSKAKSKLDKAQQEAKPVDYGAEYRSSKAKGDVKRKGKPDPFAYVPLSKSVLNKRKKAKMSGQFNGLVRAARKGATAGSKNRNKNKTRAS